MDGLARTLTRYLSRILLAGFALVAVAHAADPWPAHTVRIVVAYPPGQSTDIATRYFATKLSEGLGQTFYVENRAGAFGNIGTAFAARQAADGYTLLMGASGTHAMNPFLYDNIGFDADKDFEPIAATAIIPMMISANPSLGVNTLDDLVKLAKAKPDSINVALPSVTAELVLEMLRQKGVPLFGIKFKGSGDAMAAVLGNHVQVLIDTVAATHTQIGHVKALAVTSPKAMVAMPDIKPVDAQGLPGFAVTAWNVLMVPAGTPAPIKERLTAEMKRILALPETAKTLQELGFEPAPAMTPQELVGWTRGERQKYGDIIRVAHMKAD